ncbi:MAG: tetratricopeptide repeat protein, partial [Acidobacteriaceae bacterium]
HYLLAVYYNQGSRDGIQVDSAAPTILLQTEKAVAIDSELSDAYSLMAQAQVAMQRADLAEKAMKQALALRPRDESTLLTFASIQIANSKFADAKALLNFLKTSGDQDVAQRATRLLANADKERKTESKWASKGYVDPTEEKWKAPAAADQPQGENAEGEETEAKEKPDTRKVEYLKGTLMSVQCEDKSATLKVNSGKKTWTFNVADRSKALLIGADNFECGWHGVPVSINFRASGALSGDIISLEVD